METVRSEHSPAESEWQLHIIGPGFDDIFRVPPGRTIIGRAVTAGLSLAGDRQVSTTHAELECTAGGCTIADRGSRNGTFRNGTQLPVHQSVRLADGDELVLGQTRLQLRRIAAPEPAPAEPEPVAAKEAPSPADAHVAPPAPPSPPAQAPMLQWPYDGEVPPGTALESLRLLQYLPETYQGAPPAFLARFLAIFESILLPVEWEVDNFDFYLNPATAPPLFLAWLAGWFGITFHPSWGEAQRRQVTIEAPELFARRGTKAMLSRLLEIYTGHLPGIDDGDDLPPYTFRVRVTAPPECTQGQVQMLIDAHKPAHTVYQLEWSASAPVNASDRSSTTAHGAK
jgi:phage tail-like protein